MKRMATLCLTTYPEANSLAIAANSVAVVKQLDAKLHAAAIFVLGGATESVLADPRLPVLLSH
jgi:hypothetical protein